jgi:hypothetical protein
MVHAIDRLRISAYVFVALAGMLAGLILGRFAEIGRHAAPAQEPPVPHPRSLDR